MAGMDEALSFRAYQLAGVPSPAAHWVQLRVIAHSEEAPPANQYGGDAWGLYVALQSVDGAWLRELGLPDGNLYKPENGSVHVAPGMPADRSDWHRFSLGSVNSPPEAWWRTNLNLPAYYSFHALNRLLANIDIRPGANHCFYHAPDGRWTPVPWDLDMMFIPKTHQPGYIEQIRCLEVPALRVEYQNRAREILDLFCADASPGGGQIGQLVAEMSARLCPPGCERTWPEFDMAIWNWHPRTSAKGSFYVNPAQDWRMGGSWRRTLATPDFAGFCRYIVDFCTDSRPLKNYAPNDGDPRGYGFGYLWTEAQDDQIPNRPTVRHLGMDSTGQSMLLRASPFSSPQGTNTFASLQWRLAEIRAPSDPTVQIGQPARYEIEPGWFREETSASQRELRLAKGTCDPGHTYRLRARYKDQAGRCSRWSEPIQFTVGK